MHCPRCNAEVDPQAKFCPECGASLTAEDAAAPNRGTAGTRVSDLSPGSPRDVDEERELWEGGYSPKAMIGVWVLLGLLSVGLIVLAIVLGTVATLGVGLPMLIGVALVVIVVAWLIGAAVLLVRRWSIHYKVTTQRLIHRHGLLSRTTDRIELIDVDDITYTQGLVERMVDVGTVRIKSSDASHPEFALKGIEEVERVSDLIDDARRKERRRRGLHIENI